MEQRENHLYYENEVEMFDQSQRQFDAAKSTTFDSNTQVMTSLDILSNKIS